MYLQIIDVAIIPILGTAFRVRSRFVRPVCEYANTRICEYESVLFHYLLAGRSLLRSHTGGGVSVVRISAPEILVRSGDSVRMSPSVSQPSDSSHVIPMSVEEFIDMRYMSLRRMMDGPGL